ncbi:MAG: hypothetical protein R3B96_06085 [Pirellulaceae bacterium]
MIATLSTITLSDCRAMNDETNPYSQTSTTPEPLVLSDEQKAICALQQTLKTFREQIHALGVVWIILGVITIAVCLNIYLTVIATHEHQPGEARETWFIATLLLAMTAMTGLVWIVVGVLSCMKWIGAVYVGMVATILAIFAELLTFHPCTFVMAGVLALLIVQIYRVLKFGRELKNAGIPLTATTIPARPETT